MREQKGFDMNQVITDGLNLMPPEFADGLANWSQEDGTPGTDTWATAGNAALVPADQDFGTCLEILKTQTTTRIRYMAETPVLPGLYLRISARIKARLSSASRFLMSVRSISVETTPPCLVRL